MEKSVLYEAHQEHFVHEKISIIYCWNLLSIVKFSVAPGVSNLVLIHLNYACKFLSVRLIYWVCVEQIWKASKSLSYDKIVVLEEAVICTSDKESKLRMAS